MRPRAKQLSVTLSLALLLSAAASAGQSTPVSFDITDASSTLYNFDNRDTRAGSVASASNDAFGVFYNRLNLQASARRVVVSLRLDNAWFFASRSPATVADTLLAHSSFASADEHAEFYRQKATEAGIELSNRFINWLYPAKYSVSFGDPDLEVALGDSYAQFGRGYVLSLRKQDELASDTTVRGVRLGARARARGARLHFTLLGGSLNPLRLDESSGRYLGVSSDVTPGFVAATEALMPRSIGTDFSPRTDRCQTSGTCSYAPDRLLAGQAELDLGALELATQFSVLLRQAPLTVDTSRNAKTITTVSQSVELPSIAKRASLYAELALQKLDADHTPTPPLGYAAFVSANWTNTRGALIVEARHVRRLFPLSANVSSSRAREFSTLQYNAPPTLEEIWNDSQFGNFNVCATGARVKGEFRARAEQSIFAWVGHQRTFSESAINDRCETTAANENRVWNLAVGAESRSPQQNSRWRAEYGARFDDAARSLTATGTDSAVFYRELYLRYQVIQSLGTGFALQLDGFHRRRREGVGGPVSSWLEGEHNTALEWGEQLTLGLGVEYLTRPDMPHSYFNGTIVYRPSQLVSFGLFAGQRRGAQRCVGGVCRFYPAFEGVRLDVTVRY